MTCEGLIISSNLWFLSLLCIDPIRTVRAVLLEVSSDDALSTGSDGTKLCRTYAESLLKQLTTPTDQDELFTEWLVQSLIKVMKSKDKTELWKNFYVLRSSDLFCRKWREYLESLKLNDEPLFFQHFTLSLFNQMLSDKFKDSASASETNTSEFTYEEENAIRYMGGYVIRKIREKKNMDVSFLEDSDKVYLQSQSTDWINAIDRGGLIHITDSCFQLFLAVETVTRQEMKVTTFMDDTFRQHLENMITSDSEVLFCWTMVTVDESHDNIFHELIKLWITIRGFSFAKSIVEKYRLATKKRTDKTKGLRTKLFTDEFKM